MFNSIHQSPDTPWRPWRKEVNAAIRVVGVVAPGHITKDVVWYLEAVALSQKLLPQGTTSRARVAAGPCNADLVMVSVDLAL